MDIRAVGRDKEGIGKLKQQAKWLQAEHPDAAASLLEGMKETFTVNRLGLPSGLRRCLALTNLIENPKGAVRHTSRRVTRYQDADMAMRWAAAGFLEAEKHFRKIQNVKELWILASALGRDITSRQLDRPKVAAKRVSTRRHFQLQAGHRPLVGGGVITGIEFQLWTAPR